MMICPKVTYVKGEEFVITGKFNHGTRMSKTFIEIIDFDENGNQLGAPKYSVQRYNDRRLPAGRRYFDTDFEKAQKYFNNKNW